MHKCSVPFSVHPAAFSIHAASFFNFLLFFDTITSLFTAKRDGEIFGDGKSAVRGVVRVDQKRGGGAAKVPR